MASNALGAFQLEQRLVAQNIANEIIAYLEMCQRENASLQRGMNYQLSGGNHSVILMSVRPNAPYHDRIEDDGGTLIFEGHDVPRTQEQPDPKKVDQPEFTPNDSLTQNGKFHKAAQDYKQGRRKPELVRVYEKIKQGIWSYNGFFIWLILGKKMMNIVAYSNSSWL